MTPRLPITQLLMTLVVVVFFTGCHRAPHYDSRLVAADSLMLTMPDSALVLVEAVTPDSLATVADQAYRDLLLTQARYKCYQDITAGDDSAINRTLAYYRSHSGEREKLTRAYLYKGGVMEELGRPDSAMFYFKTAEANADEKDYANLGQINTRIANLYRLYNADKQVCYEKYKQALSYYKLTGNKPLQLASLLSMGICSGIIQNDDTKHLLDQASQLATELNDSVAYYLCQELQCRQLYYTKHSLSEAKQIAFNCLKNYNRFVDNNLLLDLADIYAYSGMPDSARHYLNFVTENENQHGINEVKIRKYLTISRTTQLEGDTALSSHYDMLAHQLSDSILNNKQKYLIQQIEDSFNSDHDKAALSSISRLQWAIIIISVFAMSALFILTIIYLRRLHKSRAIINELRHTNINRHETLLEQLDVKDSVIERFVTNLVDFMQQAIETTENDSPTVIRKRIKECISDITDDKFWNELQAHIDRHHNNLISNFARQRRITPSDTRFIALSCCGFDYVEMAIVMDYTPKYISQKRKEIARKLHLRIPLQEYLDKAMRQQ